MRYSSLLLLSLNLLLADSVRCQRSTGRSEVVKCGDKCRKCNDKLNPYENRCENSISMKGIEVKGITEEEIRCCEYRMQRHCLLTFARRVCSEEEAVDMNRFGQYNVEQVLGTKCSDVKYGERFCRSRADAAAEVNLKLVVTGLTSSLALLIVWL